MKTSGYKDFEYTLAAGEAVPIVRAGNSIICLEAPEPFRISVGDASGMRPESNFEQGLALGFSDGFDRVTIRNPNAGAITVRIGFAIGDVRDARFIASGAITAQLDGGDAIASDALLVPSMTRTLIAAADNDRIELAVSNLSPSVPVFLGDETVNAFEGLPVNVGGLANIPTSAPVYAIHQGGGAVQLAILETKK